MKLPEIHGIMDGVVSMELQGIFPLTSMENVLSSMENFDGEISMEFHGNWCPNPPWNSMDNLLHGIPWKMSQSSMEIFSMEIDALILHGIPRRFFTGNRASVCTVYSTFLLCL